MSELLYVPSWPQYRVSLRLPQHTHGGSQLVARIERDVNAPSAADALMQALKEVRQQYADLHWVGDVYNPATGWELQVSVVRIDPVCHGS